MKSFCAFCLAVLGLTAVRAETTLSPIFPKPDPVGTYAEMKLPAADGRVWRQPREDWAGARERIARDPAWAGWFGEQRKAVDDWMASQHDRVEWVAGWWHEFVSPKDGSFLIWTPEVPGVDVQTLASKSDPSVPVTPAIFRAWIVIFRAKHMSMVQNAAILWRLTGETRYRDWVVSQLDFYAHNLDRWPIQDRFYGPSRLFGQPLTDANNLTKLVEAVRLLWNDVTPAQRQFWHEHLFKPESLMLDESMHRIHNIACWLRACSAQVALLYNDQELWKTSIDGPWGIRRQIRDGVTSDYLWFEQSSGYNQFATMALIPLFVSAGLQGRGAEFSREMAIVENMPLAPTWMRFADDSIPRPADTTANYPDHAPLKSLLGRMYRVLPTPVGLRDVAGVKNWDTLLDPPPLAPESLPPLPVVRSHDFHSTRFAVMKAGGWQVFFHYGQLTGSHAQAEALNYEAHYGLTDITHDSCTVGYGSPMHRDYFTRGLAQNVPLLNGEGEQKPALDGNPLELPQRGRLLAFDPGKAVMAAAQPAYRDDASAARTLRIEGNRLVDEVTLTAKTGQPQAIGLALHVQGRVRRPDGWAEVKDFGSGRPAPFGYWQEVQSKVCRDRVSFDVAWPDGQEVRLTLSVPGEFTVYLGSAPDSPVPARCDAFYLETTAAHATFTTAYEPLRPPVEKAPASVAE